MKLVLKIYLNTLEWVVIIHPAAVGNMKRLVSFFFAFWWTSTLSRSIKMPKKNRCSANTKPCWPQTWSITYICCLKELSGNTDRNTVVSHDLTPPIAARYIRFRPIAWHSWIAMRVELYGCQGKWKSLKAAIFCNFFLNFLMETVMLVYIMWQARDKLTYQPRLMQIS